MDATKMFAVIEGYDVNALVARAENFSMSSMSSKSGDLL